MSEYIRSKKRAMLKKRSKKHPKCLGDGIDHCDYYTTITCDECKYNNSPIGRKDPEAKCNQLK